MIEFVYNCEIPDIEINKKFGQYIYKRSTYTEIILDAIVSKTKKENTNLYEIKGLRFDKDKFEVWEVTIYTVDDDGNIYLNSNGDDFAVSKLLYRYNN